MPAAEVEARLRRASARVGPLQLGPHAGALTRPPAAAAAVCDSAASSTCYIDATCLPPLLLPADSPSSPLQCAGGGGQDLQLSRGTLLSPYTTALNSRASGWHESIDATEGSRAHRHHRASFGTPALPTAKRASLVSAGSIRRTDSAALVTVDSYTNLDSTADALESIAGSWQVHLRLRKNIDDPKWVQQQMLALEGVPDGKGFACSAAAAPATHTPIPNPATQAQGKQQHQRQQRQQRQQHHRREEQEGAAASAGGWSQGIKRMLRVLREDSEERALFEQRLTSLSRGGRRLCVRQRKPVEATRCRWEEKRRRILATLDEEHLQYTARLANSVMPQAGRAQQECAAAAARMWRCLLCVSASAKRLCVLADGINANNRKLADLLQGRRPLREGGDGEAKGSRFPAAIAQKIICKSMWRHALRKREKDKPGKVGILADFLQNYSRVMAVPHMVRTFLRCVRYVQRKWRTGLAARYARKKLAKLQVESRYLQLLQRSDRDLQLSEQHLKDLRSSLGVRIPKHVVPANPYLPQGNSIFAPTPLGAVVDAGFSRPLSPDSSVGQGFSASAPVGSVAASPLSTSATLRPSSVSQQNSRLIRKAEKRLQDTRERKRALEGITSEILNEHIEAALGKVRDIYRDQYKRFCVEYDQWKRTFEFEAKEAERQQQVGLNYVEIRFKDAVNKAATNAVVAAARSVAGGGGAAQLHKLVQHGLSDGATAAAKRVKPVAPNPPLLLTKGALRDLFASCIRESDKHRREKVLGVCEKR